MAKIVRTLSAKVDGNGKSEILLRLTVSRNNRIRIKSGLHITSKRFKDGSIVMPRANQKEVAELTAIENDLIALERFIIELCVKYDDKTITKDFVAEQIDRHRHPEKYRAAEPTVKSFFDVFEEFLNKHTKLSEWRLKHYRVLLRALHRFELYKGRSTKSEFNLSLDGFTVDTVNEFEKFLRNETEIYTKYPEIYISFPADTHKARKSHKPLPRGNNTIVCTFARLRAFFNWCNEVGLTDNKPFAEYKGVSSEKYGTPYYITIDERNTIANFDLSAYPDLEVQRDIFVFHCLVGCRVSDLIKYTYANIINGAVEYYANKTKDEHPEVIRVPLHSTALTLIEKYRGASADGKLFPFISPQKYNDAIKKIFTLCGINRRVTVLNPTTGKEEQRPLNEIASSHIARRTFVGNLYKKVQDPNLIGAMSGHVEGSKAFARYRDIDDETKRNAIDLLG